MTCPVCEQSLIDGESIHRHHIIATSDGGSNKYSNLVILHRHCHMHVHYGTSKSKEEWHEIFKQYKNKNIIFNLAVMKDGVYVPTEDEDSVD